MRRANISFIGGGNMARAIIAGLLQSDYPAAHLSVSDPSPMKREYFSSLGLLATPHNQEAIQGADIIILAVKPQNLVEVIEEIHAIVKQQKSVIVSLALGWTLDDLASRFSKDIAIARAMPNMPAVIQTGAVGLYANTHLSLAQKNQVEQIFRSVGLTIWLAEEDHMKIVTALSGCGPAYFFRFMSLLCDAAVNLGLDEKTAHLLTVQTAFGASKLALESSESLDQLSCSVASKGGATEAALSVFAEQGLDNIIKAAMMRASERGDELAKAWRAAPKSLP